MRETRLPALLAAEAGAAQLCGGAGFGPASDTLTFISLAWAEAAHLGALGGQARMTALILLIAMLVVAASGRATEAGTICIAPLPANARESDRNYPGGKSPREFSYDFSVQLDDRTPVPLPKALPFLTTNVPVKRKHRIVIRDSGRVIESFTFTLEARGSRHLCLSYTPWYQTWSLERPGRRPWCQCDR